MYIKNLRVQGFKSLADVELTGLSEINVFHGLNNVGKSNILQALSLYFQLLPLPLRLGAPTSPSPVTWRDLAPHGETIFQQSGPQKITWQAELLLPGVDQAIAPGLELTAELNLRLFWSGDEPPKEVQQRLTNPDCDFNLVSARRRLASQRWRSGEMPLLTSDADERHGPVVQPGNLRQALFDAAFGRDLKRRARFRQLADMLNLHFDVGELDVALDDPPRHVSELLPDDPEIMGQEILLRFLRDDLAEPLLVEDAASGVRQVLMTLAQLMLNPARVAGIEEPEMNLGPEWQGRVLRILRDLVGPEAGKFDQFFISSHAPVFEFQDSFYQVTCAEHVTQVQKLPLARRDELFGPMQPLGERRGQRLNSQNQITLYREVLEDLGLQYGDMVYFNKNAAGRWELEHESEALAELQEAFDELDAD